jgi:CheY-like chemotaxis protein
LNSGAITECDPASKKTTSDYYEERFVMKNNDLVLVVDDDVGCRELLRIALLTFRISVICACDGREAVDLAIAFRPALTFMDLNMPEMDGFDATRAIHRHPDAESLPIVAVSADATRIQRERALDAGCIEFLAKPWESSELVRILKERVWLSRFGPLHKAI